jgi:ketosteroid isomerase-like protein
MVSAALWRHAKPGRTSIPPLALQCLLAAATLPATAPALANPELSPKQSAETQVLALEKSFNDAYAQNDLPRYFAYYSEDFRGLFPTGVTSKPAYVKSWTAYIKGGSKIVNFTWTDMAINASPSGDAAVASYHAVAITKDPGKPQTAEKYDETDVWFKLNGRFQLVVVQYSDTGHAP